MYDAYDYSEFNSFNRFQNLDIIEPMIINHFVQSQTKHGNIFWKILKYNDVFALQQPDVTVAERLEMVDENDGEQGQKKISFSPFTNDALQTECSSVRVYIDGIKPIDHLKAKVGITVQAIVHSKINVLTGNGDRTLNPDIKDADGDITRYGANPNESDGEGNIIVQSKSRATVLLKCILAEINGLYLNGLGYIHVKGKEKDDPEGKVYTQIFNGKSFCGYEVKFVMNLDGISDSSDIGY